MYLLLGLVFCSGGSLTLIGGPSTAPSWLHLAPFIGANLVSLGAAIRPGRFERTVRGLVLFDLGLMAVAVVFGGLAAFTMSGFREKPLVIGVGCAIVLGALLAWRTYHDLPFPRELLPVSGQWARRLVGGVAVVLLQPISPGVVIAFTFAMPDYAAGPGGPEPALRWAQLAFLISAPFYLALLYRFLVDGRTKHLEWHPTLAELLAEHRLAHPEATNAFARMVLRFEIALHRRVCGLGDSPHDAAAKTRVYFLEAWQSWPLSLFDQLTEDDVSWMADHAFERTTTGLGLGESDLWTQMALSRLPARERDMMRYWLIDPTLFAWTVRTWSEPDHVIAAELRAATVEVLEFIVANLPARDGSIERG